MRSPAALRNLALSFLLSTWPASAQTAETVNINDSSLTGLWKIAIPKGMGTNFVSARFEPMGDVYCRITQSGSALAIDCLTGGFPRSGTGTVDGRNVHIAWGSMMARMVVDGVRTGSSIDGHFAFKLSGISHEDADLSHSERLAPPTTASDGGGKSALLKAVLQGQAVPRDDAAIAKNDGAVLKPGNLGAIQVIAYLGQSPKHSGAPDLNFFSVYVVEFENGDRICGLHQRDDGVLDGFRCV